MRTFAFEQGIGCDGGAMNDLKWDLPVTRDLEKFIEWSPMMIACSAARGVDGNLNVRR
jgi:hypothetical protein